MGQKVPPGLIKRGDVWHIQKTIGSRRIRESTGTGDLAEAERYLMHRIQEIRNAAIFGIRPQRTFRDAAIKYLHEASKKTVAQDAHHLDLLDRYIGEHFLENVHMGTLRPFIEARLAQGRSKRTVNYALQTVRHILNLAASEWMDEHGLTWLDHAPKIKLLREDDKQEPYPLSWEEQERLFSELPPYLRRMALFKVNTGVRDQEVCGLRWEWEVPVPELEVSVFIIPKHRVKNREDRLVVLNTIAAQVIEEQRGIHPEFVFVNSKGRPVKKMCREAWRHARERAGLSHVRVHDLKHTFGRRLRAAGVDIETRADLLGHKSGRITTHYSAPELLNLIDAANRVCRQGRHKTDTMVVLRKKIRLVGVAS